MNQKKIEIEEIRIRINEIDDNLMKLLSERKKLSEKVGMCKRLLNMDIRDIKREKELMERIINEGSKKKLEKKYLEDLFKKIIENSVKAQEQGDK